MLYHNDTTAETYEAAASPVSFVGDVVDPAPLRAALDQAASLVELCDSELLASFTHLEQASRLVDALKLRLFQEIAERSPSDGPSLARDHGHKDAIDLLVRLTGASRQDVRARLELAAVLPVPEPSWAAPSPGFSDSSDLSDPTGAVDPDASDDLPPPGDDTGPIAEPLFSYVEKAIRSGELPENTAIRIKQEITKFQQETTNTTPEQILHAEKLLVAKAVGAEIPDDPAEEFVLDFDFDVTTPGTSVVSPNSPGSSDGSGPADDSGTPGASGDTTGGTTPPTPTPPVRPSRPNLPVPVDSVGRETRNVITKIAPTSSRVERVQLDRRSVKFGREYQGLVRVEARVVPEVAALMQRAFDVLLSPRTTPTEDLGKTSSAGAFGDAGTRMNSTANGAATQNRNTTSGTSQGTGVRFTKTTTTTNPDGTSIDSDTNTGLTITDDRTPEQKRHDAFAALMEAALKAGHLPQTANGAATLVVTISEEELNQPDGTGRMIDHFGQETPVTARTARHTACNGRVMLMRHTRKGRIVELQNLQRVFTEHQRKAIIARDGGCVIPGCEVPAGWCEIHHVISWTEQQETDVSNGVALCWWHHRTIETSGWDIRMRDGVPEVKAPPGIDPEQRWRPARPRIPEHTILLAENRVAGASGV